MCPILNSMPETSILSFVHLKGFFYNVCTTNLWHELFKHSILVKNGTDIPNDSILRQRGDKCPVEPTTKLISPFFIHYLLITLHIIQNHHVWTLTIPEKTPHFLLGTFSNDSEFISILKLYDDVSLCFLGKSNMTFFISLKSKEVCDILILLKSLFNLPKEHTCLEFRVRHNNHKLTLTKEQRS